MENFYNSAVMWFLLGFLFFLLEFALPGFIMFFFAVGAWIVALVLLFTDISINTQLTLFLISSLLTILLFRKSLKRLMWSRQHSSEVEDEFIGKKAKAETSFGPGHKGKIAFKGTSWEAKSDDIINIGDEVVITGNESILLIVKSSKTNS